MPIEAPEANTRAECEEDLKVTKEQKETLAKGRKLPNYYDLITPQTLKERQITITSTPEVVGEKEELPEGNATQESQTVVPKFKPQAKPRLKKNTSDSAVDEEEVEAVDNDAQTVEISAAPVVSEEGKETKRHLKKKFAVVGGETKMGSAPKKAKLSLAKGLRDSSFFLCLKNQLVCKEQYRPMCQAEWECSQLCKRLKEKRKQLKMLGMSLF
ncbi:hypothetical protein Dimus_010657 [Dionaea muscipula]